MADATVHERAAKSEVERLEMEKMKMRDQIRHCVRCWMMNVTRRAHYESKFLPRSIVFVTFLVVYLSAKFFCKPVVSTIKHITLAPDQSNESESEIKTEGPRRSSPKPKAIAQSVAETNMTRRKLLLFSYVTDFSRRAKDARGKTGKCTNTTARLCTMIQLLLLFLTTSNMDEIQWMGKILAGRMKAVKTRQAALERKLFPRSLMARLFLNKLLRVLSSTAGETPAGYINAIIMPSSYTKLYGPNTMGRPADLSPGGYVSFVASASIIATREYGTCSFSQECQAMSGTVVEPSHR
ncbi:hypothetical protein IW261DRAFT_1414622 [Armillaria novae-zelandiae]|uniref:Uncharacterized protein n=1 Tax=Armillaria novae-zelandiae TaxID=153914 RepID=A0AA39UR53_9AGAR|nr:hypothetical protein IW261DRAFT_1414622 [Armillaria novae-zelandiae]